MTNESVSVAEAAGASGSGETTQRSHTKSGSDADSVSLQDAKMSQKSGSTALPMALKCAKTPESSGDTSADTREPTPTSLRERKTMTRYALGLLFDALGERVLLLLKRRPDWQRGKFNGIGGKIENGEDPHEAMVREAREELGIMTRTGDWRQFAVLTDSRDYAVVCFSMHSNHYQEENSEFNPMTLGELSSTEDEEAVIFDVRKLPENIIPNVRWLVPMAASLGLGERANWFLVEEQ